MRVDRIWAEGNGVLRVRLAAGALALEALIVRGAQRELRLRAGSRVDAIVKATAIQLAPIAAGEQKEDGSPTHAP
jgi:molybdopterin-binding protein